MALNTKWLQDVMLGHRSLRATADSYDMSDSGCVHRAIIDGVLVVYDPQGDIPTWLQGALDAQDDDGQTEPSKSDEQAVRSALKAAIEAQREINQWRPDDSGIVWHSVPCGVGWPD